MKNLKIEIKWALIFTGVTLLWMLLEKAVGLHDRYLDYHLYLTNLFAIPAIVMMVLALKDKKKNFYGGQMDYKQGFLSGVMVSVFIALLSPLAQWITSYVITPEYFPNVIKRSVELGYFKTLAEAEANFNYKNYAVQGAIAALVMGVVTTAIAMVFIRSKK
ncbi:DUF4199 domain-containing protein [Robiginitalea marina]|uniref:DUF4199 domain-containing protein n=1 Tax=Robiginitalea marina TaxID=2954105 RepID=A0ABT1AYG3_9FLAO|nr:DUF4199 domain-containing protein [Robiginitalea marina]MCO5724931.1 DUF4199 domain-containing protein [Robiginitalea marina]